MIIIIKKNRNTEFCFKIWFMYQSLEPASISRSSQSCSSEGDSSNALPFKTGLKKAAGAEEASVRTEEKEMVADAGRNLSSNLRFSREMDREREGVGREGEGGGTVSSEEEPLSEKETLLRVPGAVVQKVVPKVVVKVVHERAKREGTEGAQKEAHEETSETSACEGEGLLISKFLPALGEGGKRVRGSHGLTSMQAPRTGKYNNNENIENIVNINENNNEKKKKKK
ncbi:hypothetical protein T492DRAFT_305529 [Pavlovales sp. CCMP2436]|nr:hypothetical protein T492DRAFT_305529 [Pavlovales sp. CCMP2436]